IVQGPVVAMVVEGDNAIKRLRMLCGPTSVDEAQPGTIRGDFCMHTPKNIIHASDSPETAIREISLFFTEDEINEYEVGNAEWL
ncbi:MAG: nucleoside-diphosphate kinase, partial [Spirochaetia bacterium]